MRLVDLRVDVSKLEHVRRHRLLKNVLGKLQNAFLVRSGRDNKADRKIVGSRQRFGHDREHLDGGNSSQLLLHDRQIIFCRRLARSPRLQNHSSETTAWIRKLECKTRVRNIVKHLFCSIGITNCIVDRGISRGGNDAENDSLIFLRGKFLRGDFWYCDKHQDRER